MRLLSIAIAALLVQLTPNPGQPARKASLEGSVTRFGTGQPVAGARVSVTRSASPAGVDTRGLPSPLPPNAPISVGGRPVVTPPIPAATTDDKGKFSFPELDEGSYTIQVQANGYVQQTFGQRFQGGPGSPVTLGAGQVTKDIVVSLTPAANVSGRIRDTSDKPLAGVPVQLLRYAYESSGQRTYQRAGVVYTNDRGEYRLYWVTPGRYYLTAGEISAASDAMTAMAATMTAAMGRGNPSGSPLTLVRGFAYYPGVSNIADARPIDLRPGADLQAMDVTLPTKPATFRIRGRVIDSRTGQPPPRANVSAIPLTPGADASGLGASGFVEEGVSQNYNGATGTLEIRDLPPGVYSLSASVTDLLSRGAGGQPRQLSGTATTVSISNADVDNVVLTVVPGTTLSGQIRVEGQLPQGLTINRLRVVLQPAGGSPRLDAARMQSPPTNADGSFLINNVIAGEYRVSLQGVPTGAVFIKEARFDGVDVLNAPIRLSGPSSATLNVVVTTAGGRLSGTVTDTRLIPVPNSRVVIVPDRLRDRAELYRAATSDNTGRYTITGIPAGDYKVFAWEDVEQFGWFDRDLLARSEARGLLIRISETSVEIADVRLIPAGGQQ